MFVLFPIHMQFFHDMQKAAKKTNLKKARSSHYNLSDTSCKTAVPCSAPHAKGKRNTVWNLNTKPTHTTPHLSAAFASMALGPNS